MNRIAETTMRYTDSELLDFWLNKNIGKEELINKLCAEDEKLKKKDARARVERILCRWQFESQGKEVPELWR